MITQNVYKNYKITEKCKIRDILTVHKNQAIVEYCWDIVE